MRNVILKNNNWPISSTVAMECRKMGTLRRNEISIHIQLMVAVVGAALLMDMPVHAQVLATNWEVSKKLGEVAIRMVPTAQLLVSDSGARMSEPEVQPTLKANLQEFDRLLKDGAKPSAIRILGFQRSGPQSLGSGLTVMSTGNVGRVVRAEEGGLPLYLYLKVNKLQEACNILAAHGTISPEEMDNFKTLLVRASEELRKGDPSKMLGLMPEETAKTISAEFDSYKKLKEKLQHLRSVMAEKGMKYKLPSGMTPADAEDVFEQIRADSTFESDGEVAWVGFGNQQYLPFKKVGSRWDPQITLTQLPEVITFCSSKGLVADGLSEGITNGGITDSNIEKEFGELVQKHLRAKK